MNSAFFYRGENWELILEKELKRFHKRRFSIYEEANLSLDLVVPSAWGFGMRYCDYLLLLQKLSWVRFLLSNEVTRTGIGGLEYRD